MNDFRSPVDDILFTLEHGADAARLPDWDPDLAAEIVGHAARFIDERIAPLDPLGDGEGARLESGRARLPAPFVAAYRDYAAAGWPGLTAPEAYGGQSQPEVLGGVVSELLSGACVGLQTLLSLGQGSARTLLRHGSDHQKARYLPRLVSGEWLATMCLTEPAAGSDLGRISTVATPEGDGWRLSGTKIFITGGDQNLTDNILHLVLARTAGAPAGVKGLALFLCPAVLEDGSRNAVAVMRLEEKMGLHASPTCQLAFDGAQAEILGAPGEGLARMFTMMNATRLDVGLQGVGLAEAASQRAWRYAAERVQGRSGRSGESADPIFRHGDVQRMLLHQQALTAGCRALSYRTAVDLTLGDRPALIEFLTPVCKAFCTDSALLAANLALQVHGGYGYTREYRVEQVLRDTRITLIYEGTNGIQSMTLAGRLLHAANGACVAAFEEEIGRQIAAIQAADHDAMAQAVTIALEQWRRATNVLLSAADPAPVAEAYLRLTGLVAFGAVWGLMERGFAATANPPRWQALADFVRLRLLPETAWLAEVISNGDQYAPAAEEVFSGA